MVAVWCCSAASRVFLPPACGSVLVDCVVDADVDVAGTVDAVVDVDVGTVVAAVVLDVSITSVGISDMIHCTICVWKLSW